MKLKLNNNELCALCLLVNTLMVQMQKRRDDGLLDLQDKLDLALTERLWITLYKKQLEVKPKYSVNLSAEMAINFYLQFNDQVIPNAFLQNLVRQICSRIHQQYV